MRSKCIKKYICAVLAMLMMLSSLAVLASCGTGEQGNTNESGTTENDTEAGTTSEYGSLTHEKFGGKEFSILNREDLEKDFFVESYGSKENDLLDDYIYERNRVIENDYGIKFVYTTVSDYTKVNNDVINQASGGLDEFDIAIGHKYSCGNVAQGNYLYDLAKIDTLRLDAKWWDSACYANMTVNGKTFLMVGDILPSSMKISACFTFNKKMMRDLGMTEPYQMVRDGSWTLDAFNQLTADVTKDKNGDGTINYKDDVFGMTAWAYDAPFSMFYGAGGMFITFDADGTPELSYDAEKLTNIYDKLYMGLMTQQAYYVTDVSVYGTNYDVFTEGRALFCDITLGKITSFLSDMTEDYGIVPVPKYDEYQEEYLSFVNGATGFIMVINSEQDPDFVGTIVDAMGAYNYDKVTPNMFEIITKLKSARDPDSAEMVDYIIRNRIYDFGYFFDLAITNVVQGQLAAKKAELSSAIKSADKSSRNALKKILKSKAYSAAG